MGSNPTSSILIAWLVEWLITLVLKTSEVQASEGSNPSPCVTRRDPHANDIKIIVKIILIEECKQFVW